MQEFHILTTAIHADDLSTALSDLGAVAVTWQDAGNQPIYEPKPGEELHWDNIKLIALFDEENLIPSVNQFLADEKSKQTIYSFNTVTVDPNQDWIRASLDLFVPTKFTDRFWVCPSWHTPPNPNAINMMFDPGLAFGTGSHPTTALCLEWLATHIKGHETIVDYGCGSGILAIAALLLGAANALAVDYDPQALAATKLNAELNQITDKQLQILTPEEVTSFAADIVIANIISKPLIELAPRITALCKSNGRLVLSGILLEQKEDVIQAYATWFTLSHTQHQENWVCLEFLKLATPC